MSEMQPEQPQPEVQEAPAGASPETTPFMPRNAIREAELGGTELKVWQALHGTGMTEAEVQRAMHAMMDHGITFGEEGNA